MVAVSSFCGVVEHSRLYIGHTLTVLLWSLFCSLLDASPPAWFVAESLVIFDRDSPWPDVLLLSFAALLVAFALLIDEGVVTGWIETRVNRVPSAGEGGERFIPQLHHQICLVPALRTPFLFFWLWHGYAAPFLFG